MHTIFIANIREFEDDFATNLKINQYLCLLQKPYPKSDREVFRPQPSCKILIAKTL